MSVVASVIRKVLKRYLLPANYLSVTMLGRSMPVRYTATALPLAFSATDRALLHRVQLSYPTLSPPSGHRDSDLRYTILSDVLLLGQTGLVFCRPANAFVVESGMTIVRTLKASRLALKRRGYRRVRGLTTSIFHHPWAETSIYHWLVECLPRLTLLAQIKQLDAITLLLPRHLPLLQRQTLTYLVEALPDTHVTLTYLDSSDDVRIDSYLFLPFLSRDMFGYITPPFGEFMRSAIIKGYDLASAQVGGKRIFISRAKASKRRVSNETVLAQWLIEKYDFEIHFPEDYDFRSQVALFVGADTIVSSHGAGLTNIMFCGAGTQVLELFARDNPKPHYLGLAKAFNLEYHYLLGGIQDGNQDYSVPLEEFQQAIARILSGTDD